LGKNKKFPVNLPDREKKEIEKEVPLKEDVDLEFEFKVYLLYEKLKKYKYLIIGGFVAIILGLTGWYLYEKHLEKKKEEASLLVYEISQLYDEKKDKELKEKIKEFKEKYGDTDYMKVVLSYEYLLKKENKNLKPNEVDNVISMLETLDLKNYLKEFKAYLFYDNKKYKEALSILDTIDQRSFNYISALTLKAIVLKKEGNPQYKNILEQVKNLAKTPYFKQFAQILLSQKEIQITNEDLPAPDYQDLPMPTDLQVPLNQNGENNQNGQGGNNQNGQNTNSQVESNQVENKTNETKDNQIDNNQSTETNNQNTQTNNNQNTR